MKTAIDSQNRSTGAEPQTRIFITGYVTAALIQ